MSLEFFSEWHLSFSIKVFASVIRSISRNIFIHQGSTREKEPYIYECGDQVVCNLQGTLTSRLEFFSTSRCCRPEAEYLLQRNLSSALMTFQWTQSCPLIFRILFFTSSQLIIYVYHIYKIHSQQHLDQCLNNWGLQFS